MPYTIKFSDITKSNDITIPDMPPGINTVDTSLSLIGHKYPNYGKKLAENFLHLLENFASSTPPANPIEGQLWYDTSDVLNKVLRIMDGSATSASWPSANGIYQQSTDPATVPNAHLKNGDIWVDTNYDQLKIYSSNKWIVVGPVVTRAGNKTGVTPDTLESSTSTYAKPSFFPVVKTFVGNDVVSIAANNSFTPKVVIEGFTDLTPGITISTKFSGKLNSISNSAFGLQVNGLTYDGSVFLRKNDNSPEGQVVTGKMILQQPTTNVAAGKGNFGLIISSDTDREYIQLYKGDNDAILLNNLPNGRMLFKTKNSLTNIISDTLIISQTAVHVNTSINISGDTVIAGHLRTAGSTELNGPVVAGSTLTIGNSLVVGGDTNAVGTVYVGSESSSGDAIVPNSAGYNIGTVEKPFKRIYATEIGSTGTVIHGVLQGEAYFPSGMIIVWAGNSPPAKWIQCDGRIMFIAQNPALFAVIGYTYGGAGPTFSVPNLPPAVIDAAEIPIYYIIKT